MVEAFAPETTAWLEEDGADFLRALGVGPGHHVLDFGCGIGGYVLPLIRVVSPDGRVIAVNRNPERLAQLRQTLEGRLGAQVVEARLTDGGLCLSWVASQSLDSVLVFDVLQHVEDWETLFGEIARMLKREGRLHVNPSFLSHPGKVDAAKLMRVVRESGFVVLGRRRARIMHHIRMQEDEVLTLALGRT